MMEPSEQLAYDKDPNAPEHLPSGEERAIVETSENLENYIQVDNLAANQEHLEIFSNFTEIRTEDGNQFIELNGQSFVIEKGPGEGEYYVILPDGVMSLESVKDDEANDEGYLPAEVVSDDIENHSSIAIEQQENVVYEDSGNNQAENCDGSNHGDAKHLTLREVSNGVRYVQTLPGAFSSTISSPEEEIISSTIPSPEEEIKNDNLLNLADVAQGIQSTDALSETAEPIQDLKSQSLAEESVIVSQIHDDTDSISMYPNSETEEDTATDLASEHDSKSGLCETSMDNVEAEQKTVERQTSFTCISSTRTLDNTVSVIHTTSSTYINDDLEKDVESSHVSNDCPSKLKLDTIVAESEQSEDSATDVHENLSQDKSPNPNDNFSNQDEDSVLSQNCGLDLTKESKVGSPLCEDSLPAVEHTRSRYGIMDSLNKDKQTSYYDTNTSEDTINSSSRSTNITEDGESVCENNSMNFACIGKEVVSEVKLSSEKLSTEFEHSNSRQDSEVTDKYDRSSPVAFQASEILKETNNSNEGSRNLRKRRSFRLRSNDSDSKNSALSDNGSIPSLPTKKINSVRIGLSPKQVAKTIDTYDFDDASTEADNDSNPQISLKCQEKNMDVLEEETNPKVFASEMDADEDGSAQKVTFHKALNVLDEEETNTENNMDKEENIDEEDMDNEENVGEENMYNEENVGEENMDNEENVCEENMDNKENVGEENIDKDEYIRQEENIGEEEDMDKEECGVNFNASSQELFNSSSEMEESDDICKIQEGIPSMHESSITEQESLRNNNENPETLNAEITFEESLSKVTDAPALIDTEQHFVKTPQRNYTRKRKLPQEKIELFSFDESMNKNTLLDTDREKAKTSKMENPDSQIEMDDNIESNVQIKVSATYNRKPKRGSYPPVVRANRAHSLRPRFSTASTSLENGTVDPSLFDLDEQIASQEKMDSDDANWAAILLNSNFSPSLNSAEPPASSAGTASSTTTPSNSQPSRERKKTKHFTMTNSGKSPMAYGKQFDKLINSPAKVKDDTATDKENKKKLKAKVKRQAMSLCNSLSQDSIRTPAKRGRPKATATSVPNLKVASASSSSPKMSEIQIVPFVHRNNETENSLLGSPTASKEDGVYTCDQCNYISTRSNNFIRHMKLCGDNLDKTYNRKEEFDPKKIQRLRGDAAPAPQAVSEDKSKKIHSRHWNGSSKDSIDQPSCSTSLSKHSDTDREDSTHAKEKFGFAEKEVVWIKRGRWHWPALVWDIKDKETLLYVISSPNVCEPLKIASQSLGKMLHSFDEVTWNKKLIENAKAMPNHSNFIKAVQKAETYIRKRLISDDIKIDVKEFFNIKETVGKAGRKSVANKYVANKALAIKHVASKSTAIKHVASKSTVSQLADNKRAGKESVTLKIREVDITSNLLDHEKILDCIFEGRCDKHVVSIYKKLADSERQEMFLQDPSSKELELMSWFSPFKTDSTMQLRLFDHFYDLYKEELNVSPDVPYIYKVWIPEGIIKAISLIKNISTGEAEILFFKQETVVNNASA